MQVEIPLSAEDIKQSRARLRDGGPLRPGVGAFAQGGLAGGLFLMVAGVVLVSPEVFGGAASLLSRIDVLLVFAGALIAVLSLLWLWRRSQAYGPLVSGPANQTLRLGLSAKGMTTQSMPEPWELPWSQLEQLEEDESYVVFRLKDGEGLILPKQAFASVEACRAFVDEAKACAEQGKAAGAP